MEQPIFLRMLVIEDDIDTCENLRDILELDGHAVFFAHTAAEALRYPQLQEFTTILLDWKLPDATAIEILPRLRKVAPDADVVIITGHGDFNLAVSALRQGAADYLLKPINLEALRSSLLRLGRQRWLAQEKSRSEAMFRNLVQAAPCVIVILRQNGTLAYFSPFAEELTGYRASDVADQNLFELLMPELGRDQVQQNIAQVLRQGKMTGYQGAVRCQNGTQRWLIWNAQRLDDVDGQPGILAVGQDVTEHRRATERLVQSERLSAIGEAMTGLAHESRNALQRSQAYLELLAVEVAGQPEPLQLVSRIQEAQNHLHQLYEEVREYAAPIRIEPHLFVPHDLLLETWSYLELARQGRDAQIFCHDESNRLEIPVDRFLIQQVFRNLLENSLAACTDPVEISTSYRVRKDFEGTWMRISVRDNGPGLTAEQQERIFDPFYTTKMRGTGLGMTLCRRIVEAHGGKIFVGSPPGTEIVMEFPIPAR